eukprot:366191-Chlamydomonas_euryale.AAC.5
MRRAFCRLVADQSTRFHVQAVEEYLQFHFGKDEDILPYANGPKPRFFPYHAVWNSGMWNTSGPGLGLLRGVLCSCQGLASVGSKSLCVNRTRKAVQSQLSSRCETVGATAMRWYGGTGCAGEGVPAVVIKEWPRTQKDLQRWAVCSLKPHPCRQKPRQTHAHGTTDGASRQQVSHP